ncbi:hypothetical protein LEP1GSC051_1808 [Leptospira sp. P2653]|uniref:Uncharacterized protein n=1 Tax=Leptospira weilii str. UI 13098 TaxID=1088542 RepID=M6PZV3_9LEPT|nr:hypothetical protein LEP1GSC051_1808 [Leptospira sp. P2653]EMN45107.1 hypothetical protein LEP1GSC086_2698 [Leptospira weilii str. LNT 1234]EMN88574.1 hypothetical protein LEP1GSC108_0626 [Leptospira weilii str. UI 13098]
MNNFFRVKARALFSIGSLEISKIFAKLSFENLVNGFRS